MFKIKMERKIIDQDNNVILDTLQSQECIVCIKEHVNNGYAQIKCKYDNLNKRIAFHSGKNGTLFLCSSDSKTTKLFKDEFQALIPCIKTFAEITNNVSLQRTDRVIHNLKTINGHAIQELENLVPQIDICNNQNIDYVTNVIKKNPKDAALTFFRMAKLNRAMKAEFTVYEKLLHGDNITLQMQYHKIPDIIMNVVYPFFVDFHEKEVYVHVDKTDMRVSLDFETFYVALYHLIENASKYVKPKTQINITFNVDDCNFITKMNMQSLYIEKDEINNIFEEGYSGLWAQKTDRKGKGIGMFRARKLIELNNGKLTVEAGEDTSMVKGIKYATNVFSISMPIDPE
jgi:light-regulated signal transduction histidine kinase (bacteriophytochrome)